MADRPQPWLALLVAAFGVGVAGLLLWLGQPPSSPAPAGDPASAARVTSTPETFPLIDPTTPPAVTAPPPSAVQLTRRRVAVTPTR